MLDSKPLLHVAYLFLKIRNLVFYLYEVKWNQNVIFFRQKLINFLKYTYTKASTVLKGLRKKHQNEKKMEKLEN